MLVYLAGCMSEYDRLGCFNIATEWKTEASKILRGIDIRTFNPCFNYNTNKTFNPKGVVTQNLAYLKNSDILLLNLDKLDKSQGTLFEIYWSYLNDIPVIAFNNNFLYGTQPHVTESITMHFEQLVDALDYIRSMYSQDN